MELNNYREVSQGIGGAEAGAGFQFEFFCTQCGATWKSPFRPYRMGQLTGFLQMFSFMFDSVRNSGIAATGMARAGQRGVREKALGEAIEMASGRFVMCGSCHKGVCRDCYSERDQACTQCAGSQRQSGGRGAGAASTGGGSPARAAAAAGCPNCGTPSDGGRFCPECGFDMASTHKSCPGCGTMVSRASRFCTDCGHAF